MRLRQWLDLRAASRSPVASRRLPGPVFHVRGANRTRRGPSFRPAGARWHRLTTSLDASSLTSCAWKRLCEQLQKISEGMYATRRGPFPEFGA